MFDGQIAVEKMRGENVTKIKTKNNLWQKKLWQKMCAKENFWKKSEKQNFNLWRRNEATKNCDKKKMWENKICNEIIVPKRFVTKRSLWWKIVTRWCQIHGITPSQTNRTTYLPMIGGLQPPRGTWAGILLI